MDNPFKVEIPPAAIATASSGPGALALISPGNHPSVVWAQASAVLILNTADLHDDRLQLALQLRNQIAAYLTGVYDHVIEREIDHLHTFLDHSDSDYDVGDIAERSVREIRKLAEDTPWKQLIQGGEWSASAFLTIANHLASAIHVERLLFADLHADNKAAVAYKRRFFTG